MSLQNNILKSYRTHYPQDTLREISQRTGIQLTRIFRLLNGSSMKLSEYELFHDLIENEKNQNDPFCVFKILRENGYKLSNLEMKKIFDYISRRIQINELVSNQEVSFNGNQELA